MKAIKSFKGKNYFLSNFYPCDIEYEGRNYASVECAYQAAKTLNDDIRYYFTIMDNSMEARRWGNQIQLRDDWDTARYNIMYELLKLKFTDASLKAKLLATEDAFLEEGNMHGDKYWGTVKGEGQNNLGKLLMQIREEIR
jgi:ribA/ribD-fused uncharacterized protein